MTGAGAPAPRNAGDSGRGVVCSAAARGHALTCFNRVWFRPSADMAEAAGVIRERSNSTRIYIWGMSYMAEILPNMT